MTILHDQTSLSRNYPRAHGNSIGTSSNRQEPRASRDKHAPTYSTSALPLIPPQRRRQHPANLLAQFGGRDDFGVGAVALHVHQQFARVGVWQGEFQGAVGQQALALGGAPVFVGYPAGGVRGEVGESARCECAAFCADERPRLCRGPEAVAGKRAGEDAVAGFLVGV